MRISDWSSDVCSSDLPITARTHDQRIALMTNGRQEIAACTHRYSHQESVGPQMLATCKHGCNRCHDKHCRSIVEKWRHLHCRDKYEVAPPPDRQHACHGRNPHSDPQIERTHSVTPSATSPIVS